MMPIVVGFLDSIVTKHFATMSLQGIAVGMNEAGLNQCSGTLFKIAPLLFSGSQPTSYGITANWNVATPPVFNLAAAPAALPHLLSALNKAVENLPDEVQFDVRQAAEDTPSFNVLLSPVNIVFQDDQSGVETPMSIDVTIYCVAEVMDGKIQLSPIKAVKAPISDAITNTIVDKILLPRLINMIAAIFQGLSIPPISVVGVPMGNPNIVIQNRKLIAFTAPIGIPASISSDMTFPDNQFFILMDNSFLQAITNINIGSGKTVSGSGSVGISAGGADYTYSITVANPSIAIKGTGMNIDFNLTGSASAEVKVLWVPIPVGFKASGEPNPSATASFQVSGNSIKVVIERVSQFAPDLSPTGNPLQWIISATLTPIIQTVAAAVVPALTTFIHDIEFTSFDIPQFNIHSGGVNLTINPSKLNAMNWQGHLGFTGVLIPQTS